MNRPVIHPQLLAELRWTSRKRVEQAAIDLGVLFDALSVAIWNACLDELARRDRAGIKT